MRNNNLKKLVLASMLLAVAIILQLIQRNFAQINPLLIGPLISTIILLVTYFCGLSYGLMVSILIPLIAAPLGALAPLLVPFLPFIIVGNLAFSASFAPLMKRGKFGLYIGVLVSSAVKFLVLAVSATKLIFVFMPSLPQANAKLIGSSFTLPQLIIALLGGIVAIVVIKLLARRKIAL